MNTKELWPRARRGRSFFDSLNRLDDDPILLCDCANGGSECAGEASHDDHGSAIDQAA